MLKLKLFQGDKKEPKKTLLDDFFKKTVAVPSIYWLPLNEKEVLLTDKVTKSTKHISHPKLLSDSYHRLGVITPYS